MNEKEIINKIEETVLDEFTSNEDKINSISYILKSRKDESISTTEESFFTEKSEPVAEEVIEHFEEEVHIFEEKKEVDFGSSIDAMLFSDTVADESTSSILEKEELKLVTEVDLTYDNAETLINEIKKEAFPEAPEMTAEEFNETSKDVLVEDPESDYVPPTEEEIAASTKEMIVEMKDYSTLHKREFEDLSKLQLSAELAVSPKDLMKMNSLINDNKNILETIETADDQSDLGEEVNIWSENSEDIFIIHRKYFRIGSKEAQKTLVQGVFEAFNSFNVENKIDLMKQYSEFLGEKEDEEVSAKQEDGVPLPKSYATTGPGSVPLVGEDDVQDDGPAPAKTQEEIDEENSFVTRMEDLENLLTGDFEIQDEEVPTFEKIEQIAKDHGELAMKEYISSLSQEQREQLARERVAQMKLKQATESSEMTKETQETEQPETEVAE
jgi:hypothetical protein